MKTKRIILLAGAVAIVGAVAACTTHRYGAGYCEHPERMAERISQKLDLTAEQQTKFDVVKTKMLAAREAALKQRKQGAQGISNVLSGPTFDRAQATALAQGHVRLIETNAPELIAAFGDFYDSLKPEQQQKLREQVESRMSHRFFN